MYPNNKNIHNFKFLGDCLLSLHGTIPNSKICKPKMFGQNDNPCIVILKCGQLTGLMIGCANNIISYTHYYFGKEKAPHWSGTSCICRNASGVVCKSCEAKKEEVLGHLVRNSACCGCRQGRTLCSFEPHPAPAKWGMCELASVAV
jgi:hypothetical protein